MGKTAIILGITGLVGTNLARKILKNPDYEKVISFHRRKSGINHPKLTEYVVDMKNLSAEKERFKADVVFCCIGTTQAKSEDKEEYKKIDYGIPLQAAELCKENDIKALMVISALGANADSRIFYNKTKGEMERDILKLELPEVYFFQPALLAGEREEKRTAERLAISAFKVVNPILIGPLKKYQSIKPDTITAAMLIVASTGYEKFRIESDEIKQIVKNNA